MALTEEQRNPWRAIVAGGDYNLTSQDWEDLLTELDSLYTEAPIAQPASGPTGFDAEFLAKRLGRVAKLAGVSMPENFTHEQVVEAAGTILGQIAAAMEAKPARAPSAQKPVEQWEATTTYLRRIGDAIELLCSGNRASDEIISAWLDTSLDDFRLQEFACEHGPSWSQGIAVIDAATVLADQPTEGVEHELSPHTTYKAQRDALLKCLALIEPKLDFSRWENGQGEDIGKEINAAIALVKGGA